MTVNTVSAISIAVLLICCVTGYKVGFLRMIVRLITTTVIVECSGFFATYVGRFLVSNTNIDTKIYDDLIERSPLMTLIAEDLSVEIVYGVAFFLCFILIGIFLKITRVIVRTIERIPIIRGINKLLGIVPGAAIYFITVWLIMYFAEISQGYEWGRWIMDQIERSEFLFFLYDRNLIKEFLLGIRLM